MPSASSWGGAAKDGLYIASARPTPGLAPLAGCAARLERARMNRAALHDSISCATRCRSHWRMPRTPVFAGIACARRG
eukprot:7791218-Pyramimonas_sp.AAC.1